MHSDVPVPLYFSGMSWSSLRWRNTSQLQLLSSEWLWGCLTAPQSQRRFPGGCSSVEPGTEPVHRSSPWSLDFRRWEKAQSWASPCVAWGMPSRWYSEPLQGMLSDAGQTALPLAARHSQGGWWRRTCLWHGPGLCHRSVKIIKKCIVSNTQLLKKKKKKI